MTCHTEGHAENLVLGYGTQLHLLRRGEYLDNSPVSLFSFLLLHIGCRVVFPVCSNPAAALLFPSAAILAVPADNSSN